MRNTIFFLLLMIYANISVAKEPIRIVDKQVLEMIDTDFHLFVETIKNMQDEEESEILHPFSDFNLIDYVINNGKKMIRVNAWELREGSVAVFSDCAKGCKNIMFGKMDKKYLFAELNRKGASHFSAAGYSIIQWRPSQKITDHRAEKNRKQNERTLQIIKCLRSGMSLEQCEQL